MNPPDAAPRLGYATAGLVRDAEERDETTLPRALAHPDARFHLSLGGRWLAHAGSASAKGTFFDALEAAALGGEPQEAVLLGWNAETGAPCLALALPKTDVPDSEIEFVDLRAAGMAAALPAEIEGDLAQAQALLNWHARTLFCGVCGTRTASTLAGYRRDCPGCGATHFPRTDPVVIMLVHDGAGACVFGRQSHFAPGMWSCLAGFVEPGETIENAVRREIREEVGLEADSVSYALSQPWPFPGSLMIGCVAEARGDALSVQESELEAARWFPREEVAAMIEQRHPEGLSVPRPFAIAHHLARIFVAG